MVVFLFVNLPVLFILGRIVSTTLTPVVTASLTLPLRGTREPLLNRVLIIKKAMNLILHMDLSRVRGRTMVTDPRRDCYHMRSSTVFSTVHVVIHLGSSRIYHMRSVNIQSNEPFTLIHQSGQSCTRRIVFLLRCSKQRYGFTGLDVHRGT